MSTPFALLGDIEFSLITYFNSADGTIAADYAEHARVERKPRLQWVGDKLDEYTIQIKLHAAYCDPEREIARLKDAVRAHKALTFMYVNGHIVGDFVPVELSPCIRQTMRDGTLIDLEATLRLREYVEDEPNPETTPSQAPVAAESANGDTPAETVIDTPDERDEDDSAVRAGEDVEDIDADVEFA